MTPTPHDLSDDALARDLGEQLHRVGDGIHAVPPVEGRTHVDSRVRRHRRTRRLQTGLAAVVALVVLTAGVAVLRSRGDEDGAPVVAGPPPSELDVNATEWNGIPFLAPTGVDWWIDSWNPPRASAEVTSSQPWTVSFDDQGMRWLLKVTTGDPFQPGVGAENPEDARQTTTQSSGTVGDREVTFTQLDAELRSGGEWMSADMATAEWADPAGMMVGLTAGEPPGESVSAIAPSNEVLAAMVAKVERVSLAEWNEALQPPNGVAAPDTAGLQGQAAPEVRPLRLGLPTDTGVSALTLSTFSISPWYRFDAAYTSAPGSDPVSLSVSVYEAPQPFDDRDGEPVAVHGFDGALYRSEPDDRTRPLDGWAGLAIVWPEGGSTVSMYFPEGTTDEQAIAFANSLVVLDDSQWEALLFPGVGDSSDSTGSADTDPTSPAAGVLWRSKPAADVMPFLAPAGIEWNLADYGPPLEELTSAPIHYGYSLWFEHLGRTWSLDVTSEDRTGSGLSPTHHTEVGGRSVTMIEDNFDGSTIVGAVIDDASGLTVRLQGSSEEPVATPDGTSLVPVPATEDEYRDVLGLLEEVPTEQFASKLLRDGRTAEALLLPPEILQAGFSLSPAQSGEDVGILGVFVTPLVPGSMFSFHISSEPAMRSSNAEPVRLRGVDGSMLRAPFDGSTGFMSDPDDPQTKVPVDRVLVWDEAGRTISLVIPSTATTEQAIAVAESLVHPTDPELRQVLGF